MKKVDLQDGWILFEKHFFSEYESRPLFNELHDQLDWQQGKIKIFGKDFNTPRLEAFYAESALNYGYSGQRLKTLPMNSLLKSILSEIEKTSGYSFNSVLCNLYRDGNDSNGWHADDEKELGRNPIIASLSLGEERRFDLKHNHSNEKISFTLNSGSLLIMGGSMQHFWKHQIAKSKKVISPRINLTFRTIM
jgi:alkylated DNA repair dioxygenase AlkB